MDGQVTLGAEIAVRQETQKQELADQYKSYEPRVYDISRYLLNVFKENNGERKYSPLIGDADTAITAFMAYVLGKTPVMIESLSGGGKTVITDAVLELLGDGDYKIIDNSSDMAVWNQTDEINRHRLLAFLELQKSATNAVVNELLKTLGEGKNASRNVTDVTMGGAGDDRVRERIIEWKPFLTTLAVENERGSKVYDAELSRRMIDVYTDISEEATAKVVEYQLRTLERGVQAMVTMEDSEIDMLKYHIQQCIHLVDDLVTEYRFPGASALGDYIPNNFVQTRSALPLFLRLVCAFAAFNYKDRVITEDGILLVAPQDLFQAWACYGTRFMQRCFSLEMLASELLEVFPDVPKGTATLSRQHQLLPSEIKAALKSNKVNISQKRLAALLDSFCDMDVLQMEKDVDTDDQLYAKTGIGSFDANLDYPAIIDRCKEIVTADFPEYANRYIKKHCETPVVMHPFKSYTVNLVTGQQVQVAE